MTDIDPALALAVDDAIPHSFTDDLVLATRDLSDVARTVIAHHIRHLYPRPIEIDDDEPEDTPWTFTEQARARARLVAAIGAQLEPDACHATPDVLRLVRDEVGIPALMELLPDLARLTRMPSPAAVQWDPDIKVAAWFQIVGEVLTRP